MADQGLPQDRRMQQDVQQTRQQADHPFNPPQSFYGSYPGQAGGGMQTNLPPTLQDRSRYSPNHQSSPYAQSPPEDGDGLRRRVKAHVASACVNCKKAHLACDSQRPCPRCVSIGKADQCFDVAHKRRGRPRRKDLTIAAPTTSGRTSPASQNRQSAQSPLLGASHMSPMPNPSASPASSLWGGSQPLTADRSNTSEPSSAWSLSYASSTTTGTMSTAHRSNPISYHRSDSFPAHGGPELSHRAASDSGWSPRRHRHPQQMSPHTSFPQAHPSIYSSGVDGSVINSESIRSSLGLEAHTRPGSDRTNSSWNTGKHPLESMADPWTARDPQAHRKLGLGTDMSTWMVSRDLPPIKPTALVGVWLTDLNLRILRAGCMMQDGSISSYIDPAFVERRPQEITDPSAVALFNRLEVEVRAELAAYGLPASRAGEETPYEKTLGERLQSYGDDGFELLTRPMPGAHYRIFDAALHDGRGRAVPCTISAIIGARSSLCGPYVAFTTVWEDPTGEISADATAGNNALKAELRQKEEAEAKRRQAAIEAEMAKNASMTNWHAQEEKQAPPRLSPPYHLQQQQQRKSPSDEQFSTRRSSPSSRRGSVVAATQSGGALQMRAIQEGATSRNNNSTARGPKLPPLNSLGFDMGRSEDRSPEQMR